MLTVDQGFDCLGLALNLYNIFSFTPDQMLPEYTYTFEGFGADILRAEDPKRTYWILQWIKFLLLCKNQSNTAYYV